MAEFAKFLEKISGGRYFLTIIVGVILIHWGWDLKISQLAPAVMEKVLDKILSIVELIVMFYFLRTDRSAPTETQKKSFVKKSVQNKGAKNEETVSTAVDTVTTTKPESGKG